MRYSMIAAVVEFNRFPTLAVAAARRIVGVPCVAYFDDIFAMDLKALALHSQQSLYHVLDFCGRPPALRKR